MDMPLDLLLAASQGQCKHCLPVQLPSMCWSRLDQNGEPVFSYSHCSELNTATVNTTISLRVSEQLTSQNAHSSTKELPDTRKPRYRNSTSFEGHPDMLP